VRAVYSSGPAATCRGRAVGGRYPSTRKLRTSPSVFGCLPPEDWKHRVVTIHTLEDEGPGLTESKGASEAVLNHL